MADTSNPTPHEPYGLSIRMPRPLWLALATAVVVALGIALRVGVPIYHQQTAIHEIEQLGGKVKTLPGGPEWLREWVGDSRMKPFDHVTTVLLNGTEATDATLGRVSWLVETEWISLAGTQVTDAGLRHLKPLPHLRELSLNSTSVTDAGLAQLTGLVRLERLWLDYTGVTDEGLRHVHSLTSLKELSLERTRVSDAGLVHLLGLVRLKMIYIDNTAVTETGVRELQRALPDLMINW